MMSLIRFLRPVLILALALSLAGCGNSVLGPDPTSGNTGENAPDPGGSDPGGSDPVDPPLAGPEILVIESEQPVRYTKFQQVEPVEEPVTTPGPRQLHVEAVIDGAVGGRLQCGRFLLSIPAGAFEGEGTVSMTMPDETVMVVDIEISPATLNNFNEQVQLCLLTDGTTLNEDDLQIYWWDPDRTEWKALGCSTDLSAITGTTEGILTPLSHFSRYSGGKAGW